MGKMQAANFVFIYCTTYVLPSTTRNDPQILPSVTQKENRNFTKLIKYMTWISNLKKHLVYRGLVSQHNGKSMS